MGDDIYFGQEKIVVVEELDRDKLYKWTGQGWVIVSDNVPIFDKWTYETPLEEAVMQAIGAASACWEHLEEAGIFNSDRAKKIGGELLGLIYERENIMDKDEDPRQPPAEANLGCATTEEMFRELICRFTIHYGDIGHMKRMDNAVTLAEMLGGLDALDKEYRTVGSM